MATMTSWVKTIVALVLLFATISASAEEPFDAAWLTPAEVAEFGATPGYDETMTFLRRLEKRSPLIELTSFGVSPQGREMPLVVVSHEGAFTPEAAARAGLPIVMIQNGIHSGEIDGKDASLILLRDLALGRRPGFGHGVTLLVVPIYNVDGHERFSPHNRANQNGPAAGMGFRTTTVGYDLNRDHLKLESMEARALVGLFNRWRPHLHVDNHVTDGSDHAWVFTWSWPETPQIDAAVDAWMRENLPPVLAATEAAGHRTGPYVGLVQPSDPAKGFNSWVGEPRYSGGYFPLRNRPSILVEMHAYKPYGERVAALRDFLAALVARVGETGETLVAAVEKAEAMTVAKGEPDAPLSEVVVAWTSEDTGDTIRWPAYEWSIEDSLAMGTPYVAYERGVFRGGDPEGIEVPWIHAPAAERTAPRPRGYLIEPGWPQIEERIEGHGLRFERLDAPLELDAETFRLSGPKFAERPYQGRHRVEEVEVERRLERVTMPAGSLWVPADQPDFEVAVQLLEPEAPDSMVSWGMLSTVFERKEYIEPRVLEELARELLQDSEIRAEWERALEQEKGLAGNPGARWMWWYRKTPYWDDTVGKLPYVRVMTLPRALAPT